MNTSKKFGPPRDAKRTARQWLQSGAMSLALIFAVLLFCKLILGYIDDVLAVASRPLVSLLPGSLHHTAVRYVLDVMLAAVISLLLGAMKAWAPTRYVFNRVSAMFQSLPGVRTVVAVVRKLIAGGSGSGPDVNMGCTVWADFYGVKKLLVAMSESTVDDVVYVNVVAWDNPHTGWKTGGWQIGSIEASQVRLVPDIEAGVVVTLGLGLASDMPTQVPATRPYVANMLQSVHPAAAQSAITAHCQAIVNANTGGMRSVAKRILENQIGLR